MSDTHEPKFMRDRGQERWVEVPRTRVHDGERRPKPQRTANFGMNSSDLGSEGSPRLATGNGGQSSVNRVLEANCPFVLVHGVSKTRCGSDTKIKSGVCEKFNERSGDGTGNGREVYRFVAAKKGLSSLSLSRKRHSVSGW